MVRSGSFKNPKSVISCGSSKSIKIATRSPALGLNTVFRRGERLNGGKVSGTVSVVWAIIGKNFVLASGLVKESICYTLPSRLQTPGRSATSPLPEWRVLLPFRQRDIGPLRLLLRML